MLPVGIKGMVVSIFLLGLIARDSSYLHSWGSIFIQDVFLPFHKTPFSPWQHLWLLRIAILGVAIFGFTFSLLYRQTEYVLMFFAITGAIYSGAVALSVELSVKRVGEWWASSGGVGLSCDGAGLSGKGAAPKLAEKSGCLSADSVTRLRRDGSLLSPRGRGRRDAAIRGRKLVWTRGR
jgi:hypothetical protein